MLTQEELLSLMSYDEDTGIFIWKISPTNSVFIGDIVGGLDKSTGYLRTGIHGKRYYLHRLAWLYMYGEFPKNQIDHINRNRSDNRFINLRDVTNQENHRNQSLNKRNISGINGVIWDKRSSTWEASIVVNGKKIFLGYFDILEDAILIRKSANKKYGFYIGGDL